MEKFFIRTVQFNRTVSAKRVYTMVQEYLRNTPLKDDCDLSAYNLLENGTIPVVVVFGINVPETIEARILNMLAAGKPFELDDEVIAMLIERRIAKTGMGKWQEYHFSPGERIYPKGSS